MTLERAVALDAKAGDSDGPVWNQIAKVGQWSGHPSGPFQLTPAHFAEIVANFKNTTNRKIPVDFEHASEQDPREGSIPTLGAPAQGWIIELDNRGAEGLWGLFEWLEPARGYVKERKYQFFSPTIRFGSRDPVTGVRGCRMSSGALTNQPFLDGMKPLAAKDIDSGAAGEKDSDAMTISKEQFDAEVAKVTTLTTEKATLANSEAALRLSLTSAESKLELANKELDELRKWKSDREAQDIDTRVELAFQTYKDEQKLTEAHKKAMVLVLKSDAAHFETLYPKVAASQAHLLSNLTGKQDGGTAAVRLKDRTDNGEGENIVTLADKIQKEKGCDRDRAFVLAEQQIKQARAGR